MKWNLGLFSAVSWAWRALRGHSITFAALFALTLLGVPVLGEFRHLLARWEAPWYVWLLVPAIAIGYFAKKETQWMPDVEARKKWARWIFFGSIVAALLLAKFGPRAEPEPATSPEPPAAGAGNAR